MPVPGVLGSESATVALLRPAFPYDQALALVTAWS
jgi:hypothetical protein